MAPMHHRLPLITPENLQVLATIESLTAEGQPTQLVFVSAALGYRSSAALTAHIHNLVAAGLIEHQHRTQRTAINQHGRDLLRILRHAQAQAHRD